VPGFGPEYCQQRHVDADTLHTAYVLDEQNVELRVHWTLSFVKAVQASVACVWV
jgi:hypothetical protein